MIKAVFLDWGHTFTKSGFIDTKANIDGLLKPFNLDWKSFYPFWRGIYILRSSNQIKSDKEMARWLRNVTGKEELPFEKLLDILIGKHIIPQENIETVRKLRKDYKVGILSNNVKEWIERNLHKHHIEDLFDAVIVSDEVGARKPNAMIYAAALKAFFVKPEETVFVADETAEDLVGAKGCGMKTIWLDTGIEAEWSKKDREMAGLFPPDAIVKKLPEIVPIIKRM